MEIMWVALGAGFGAVCRYEFTVFGKRVSPVLPYATLLINVLGALLAGFLTGMQVQRGLALLLLTGVCGGFTTFSTFSTDTFVLIRNKRYLVAGLYWCGTVIMGIAAVVLGLWFGTLV